MGRVIRERRMLTSVLEDTVKDERTIRRKGCVFGDISGDVIRKQKKKIGTRAIRENRGGRGLPIGRDLIRKIISRGTICKHSNI